MEFREKKNLSGEWQAFVYREGRKSPVHVGDLFRNLHWRFVTRSAAMVFEPDEVRAIAEKLDELNNQHGEAGT